MNRTGLESCVYVQKGGGAKRIKGIVEEQDKDRIRTGGKLDRKEIWKNWVINNEDVVLS